MEIENATIISIYKIVSGIGEGETFFVPKGLNDNSPAIYRGVKMKIGY
ncbi:MAG: hypothetical protein KDB79_07025 [Acidobacteria bacterium]|nr:hypothetical protein [Acidobacteriota bacterium]